MDGDGEAMVVSFRRENIVVAYGRPRDVPGSSARVASGHGEPSGLMTQGCRLPGSAGSSPSPTEEQEGSGTRP